MVPAPNTFRGGRPLSLSVTRVRMSTGFVATTIIPPGLAAAPLGTIGPKIAAFRFRRSRRDSPGFWLAPAAMTVTIAPLQSAYSPAHTRVGCANGTVWLRSMASPSARSWLTSTSTISAARPDRSRALAKVEPTKPTPTMAIRVGRFASGSSASSDGSDARSVATARAAVLSVMFLFWRRRQALVGPCPLTDLGRVLALGPRVRPGLGALVLHQLSHVAGPRRQPRDAIDGVDHQVVAVQVVEHDHVERGRGRSFLLVAANVDVVVAVASVCEAVDEPRVAVVREDDRLVRREERVELLVGHTVRMFRLWLETHQVYDIDDADLHVRQILAHQVNGSERFQRRNIAAAGHDDVRLAVLIVACPVPDADAARAVQDGLLHGQPVGGGLFAGHDHVDVVAAAQAVGGHREHRVRVRREVDADDLGLLVDYVVDEARGLMREAILVLPPHQRAQYVVERGNRAAPRDVARHLQPLGVLVEHRVDDVDEGFVAVEHAVAAGQQVALEPALALVLGEDLHDPTVDGEDVVIGVFGDHFGAPGLAGHLEDRLEAVRGRLVGSEHPEVVDVPGHDVADERAGHEGRLARRAARLGNVHGVLAEVRHDQIAEEQPAIGVRVGAHSVLTVRGKRRELGPEGALLVEQLLWLVAAHPGLEHLPMRLVGADVGDGNLMRSPGAFDLLAVHDLRAGPALGRPEDDHRPLRTFGRLARAGRRLDLADLVEDGVEGRGQQLMDDGRIVARDEVRVVAVADHQVAQLTLGDAGQDRGVGDLVAVEVEDRQDGAVALWVEGLVRMPARRH